MNQYYNIIQNYQVTEVKMDKDFSAIVYDHFSANRKRYNDRQTQQQSVNDGQSVGTFISSQI